MIGVNTQIASHEIADREIEDLLFRIRGLVLVGRILSERGASRAEIEAHEREADRLRVRLATVVVRRLADDDRAAA